MHEDLGRLILLGAFCVLGCRQPSDASDGDTAASTSEGTSGETGTSTESGAEDETETGNDYENCEFPMKGTITHDAFSHSHVPEICGVPQSAVYHSQAEIDAHYAEFCAQPAACVGTICDEPPPTLPDGHSLVYVFGSTELYGGMCGAGAILSNIELCEGNILHVEFGWSKHNGPCDTGGSAWLSQTIDIPGPFDDVDFDVTINEQP
jgi:hypothetical protein